MGQENLINQISERDYRKVKPKELRSKNTAKYGILTPV